MNLSTYLNNKKITRRTAAKQLEVEYETFRKWVVGDRIPGVENMKKIADWTHGLVTANDFYNIKE